MPSEVRQCLSLPYRIIGGVEFDAYGKRETGEGWDKEKGIGRIV
jgi:hypothetical protein